MRETRIKRQEKRTKRIQEARNEKIREDKGLMGYLLGRNTGL